MQRPYTMKAGYTTKHYSLNNPIALVVCNHKTLNRYVDYQVDSLQVISGMISVTGVWIPKNPDGTSKKRPTNWPNKKTF